MSRRRYAHEAFQPDGTLKVSPSQVVVNTLGKYGMVHPLTSSIDVLVEEMQRYHDIAQKMRETEESRSIRLLEGTKGYIASEEGKMFAEMYEHLYNDVSYLVEFVGEIPPRLEDSPFLERLPSLMEAYKLFKKLRLAPEVVLAPAHRSEEWWRELSKASSLNPAVPYKNSRSQNLYDTSSGILTMNGYIHEHWDELTGRDSNEPSWSLSVMSTQASAPIKNVSSYGYRDAANLYPHTEINPLLTVLGLPAVQERTGSEPLVQPDIHPDLETYIMYQFMNSIDTSETNLIDPLTSTWLKGTLGSSKIIPLGQWKRNGLELSYGYYDYTGPGIGIRPTARGTVS